MADIHALTFFLGDLSSMKIWKFGSNFLPHVHVQCSYCNVQCTLYINKSGTWYRQTGHTATPPLVSLFKQSKKGKLATLALLLLRLSLSLLLVLNFNFTPYRCSSIIVDGKYRDEFIPKSEYYVVGWVDGPLIVLLCRPLCVKVQK